MTYSEKIENESCNKTEIHLYKEGAFWKAYENSAMLFCKNIEQYKPSKKFVKTIGKEIISIGFPDAGLELIGKRYKIEIDDKQARIELAQAKPLEENELEENELEEWKTRTPLNVPPPKNREANNEKPQNNTTQKLLERIELFQIEIATPIECMMFLSDIKQQLKNDNGTL